MRYTQEQQSAIASNAPITKVRAFAGTGKTTMLIGHAIARPRTEFIYFAYTKSVQKAASERFPRNVKCKTTHSLAFPRFGSRFAHKLVENLRPLEISDALSIPRTEMALCQASLAAISGWFASTHETIEDFVYAVAKSDTEQEYLARIVETASNVWARMMDPKDNTIGMLHDGYLKLWALSRPQLPADTLLGDEFQDINPLTSQVIKGQRNSSLVIVGDPHQSIFSFRGGVNELDAFDGPTYNLTESWRFGPVIATIANSLLMLKGEEVEVKGLGPATHYGPIFPGSPHTCLCRTNAGVFDQAVSAVLRNQRLYFVGGINGYRFDKILDAYYLYSEQNELVRNGYIKRFAKFSEMEEHAEAGNDPEIKILVRVVNLYAHRTPDLVEKIRRLSTDDPELARITLSTAHKAKGLEWAAVRLNDDFIDPFEFEERVEEAIATGVDPMVVITELNLLYVAATRAQLILEPNETLADFMSHFGLKMQTNPRLHGTAS